MQTDVEEKTDEVTKKAEEKENDDNLMNFYFRSCELCNKLCDLIPQKYLKNFQNEPVRLTCMDANDRIIVVGSNVGHLYIFNRVLKKFSTIKGQDQTSSVKLSRNLDYDQVAVGMCNGYVIVLQLPSPDPGYSKKLLEKSLTDTHKCQITCLEWSSNGGKLFSGDNSGLVMMTLLDFENDVFHSTFVCCEDCAIVQMSFCGNYLAVSTVARAILVDIPNDCSVKQIGVKPRKKSGSYGIIFDISPERPNTCCVYTTRPNCNLWKADDQGMVQETIVTPQLTFDLALEFNVPSELRNKDLNTELENEFGILKFFNTNLLITYNGCNLFVIDLQTKQLKYKTYLFRTIRDFCCTPSGELYVLCGDRTLMRFAGNIDEDLVSFPLEKSITSSERKNSTSQILTDGRNFLKKIAQLPNSITVNLTNNTTNPNLLNTNRNNSDVDVKSFFGTVRRSEQHQDLFNSSGMSTPDTAYYNDDSSSLNEEHRQEIVQDEQRPPWLLNDQEGNNGNTTDGEGHVTSVASADVSKEPVAESSTRLQPPKTLDLVVAGESHSTVGFLSSLIDTVGGFGVKVENGLPLQIRDDSFASSAATDTSNSSTPSSTIVAVFRKLGANKKSTKQDQEPNEEVTFHPVDKLSTPTEEQYSKNRFNPFDNAPMENIIDEPEVESPGGSPSISKEQLEEFLEATLSRVAQINNTQETTSCGEPEKFEEVAEDQAENDESASEPSYDTLSHSSMDFGTLLQLQLGGFQSETTSGASSDSRPTSDPSDLVTVEPSDPWYLCRESDIWNQTLHAQSIVCVAGTSRYVCCVDSAKNLKYSLLNLSHFVWQTSEDKADWICVSPNGQVVWRLQNSIAYALLKPHKNAPKGVRWVEAATSVVSMTISDRTAWYLRQNGDLYAQTELRSDRPCHKSVKVELPISVKVVRVACNNECLWVLAEDGRIFVRTGLKSPENALGADWVDVSPIGPANVSSVSLGEGTAWITDSEYRLWFTDGLSSRTPIGTSEHMWQVSLPDFLTNQMSGQKKSIKLFCSVFALSSGIWLSYSKLLACCRTSITGHQWTRPIPPQLDSVAEFRRLSAGNFFNETTDCIWLQRANDNNELMAYQPNTKMLHSIPPFMSNNDPVAFSSSLGVLWVLDNGGRIFIRHNVGSSDLALGSEWHPLDMSQLLVCDVDRLAHLSCSMDSVWACDTAGMVYVRMGTGAVTASGLTPAWMALEKQHEHLVRRIFCSPDANFVWALADNNKIVVRYGVTAGMPIGTHWISVDDLKAINLAVGFKCVWAISVDNHVYCRYGIDDTNPAGNYWKRIPGKLRWLSVTPENQLWGIDTDFRLVKHRIHLHSFVDPLKKNNDKVATKTTTSKPTTTSGVEESDDFEVI